MHTSFNIAFAVTPTDVYIRCIIYTYINIGGGAHMGHSRFVVVVRFLVFYCRVSVWSVFSFFELLKVLGVFVGSKKCIMHYIVPFTKIILKHNKLIIEVGQWGSGQWFLGCIRK
jgi:hypothetical protein